GEVTEFGKFMDPLADKLLVLSAFVSFVQMDLIPAWMVIILFARELIITSVRMFAVTQQGTVIAAEKTGKHKTAWHISSIITILVIIAFQDYITRFIHPWEDFFIQGGGAGENFVAFVNVIPWVMTFICVIYSIYSAYDFFDRNKAALFGVKR
ncbi:MAG: CDP-alcohol phosphatidyltransferase family protein, partial [Candidatus Firestonebacteria bacterium]